MSHIRYRGFIAQLQSAAAENEGARIIEDPKVATTRDTWLSLTQGRDGGIALVTTALGTRPRDAGVTFKLDPTTTCASLAAALSTCEMMILARSLLTPGRSSPHDTLDFADRLTDLQTRPSVQDATDVAVSKPPSLDAELWRRIPHGSRHEYLKKMARGLIRGVHPDDTVTEILAAA
jgi:hypothetical protein